MDCTPGKDLRRHRSHKRAHRKTDGPGGSRRQSDHCRNARTTPLSQILPKAFEERMPHLAFGRLRPVLDLCQQLRLDPDALVRDPFGVRLRLSDQRRQALP